MDKSYQLGIKKQSKIIMFKNFDSIIQGYVKLLFKNYVSQIKFMKYPGCNSQFSNYLVRMKYLN